MSDSRSCALCHPSMPAGNTRCLRDPHSAMEIGCVECHGAMAEDAVALLKPELQKPSARRLMKPLEGLGVEGIAGRTAWHGQTDCLNCHEDFQAPVRADGFNRWTDGPVGLYRSRTDLAVWQVHAAEFNMKEGNWVPVPAFFFTHYIPAHRSCLLLPLLLYYQNLKKQNTCYASAFTLQLKLHWTLPFTYQSLRLLSNEKEWSRLKTGLPLPLAIQWRRRKGESTGAPTPAEGNPNFIRHYSLRSVWYSRDTDDGLPVIYLTPEFAKAFNIPTKSRRDILPEPID